VSSFSSERVPQGTYTGLLTVSDPLTGQLPTLRLFRIR